MKKIMQFMTSKRGLVCGAVASAFMPVLAEGETSGITSALVTPYITDGKTQILAVLTAGAAIVGAFFVWALVKKALNRSK